MENLTKIKARWQSKCATTGTTIKKGEEMYYDYVTKKCYCLAAGNSTEPSNNDFVQDPGETYFDNFCINNGY